MSFKRLEKFLNGNVYFATCMALGLALWSLCFVEINFDIKLTKKENFHLLTGVNAEVREIAKAELIKIQKREPASQNGRKVPKRFQRNPAFILFEKMGNRK